MLASILGDCPEIGGITADAIWPIGYFADRGLRMGWILRLVETGIDDQPRSVDVMQISRPENLGDISNLGLTLPEAQQILARVSARDRCRSSAQTCCPAAGMSIVRWEMPREGLAVSSDCDAVWRSDGTASPISLCCLWPDRAGRQLALTL